MNIAFVTNVKNGTPVYWSMNTLYRELKKSRFNPILVDINDIMIGYSKKLEYNVNKEKIDLCLYQSLTDLSTGKVIMSHFESMGIPTINNSKALEISSNKYLTYLRLIKRRIPIPKTFLATSYRNALKIIRTFEYPVVAKGIYGSGGRGLRLLRNKTDAEIYFRNAYYPFLIQEFIEKERDIRVFVIDNKVVLGIYRYGESWITNVDRGARIEKIESISKRLERIAINSAKAIGLQISAIDIMEKDKKYIVSETNSVPGFRKIYESTGVKIERSIIEHITKKYRDKNGL
ncbi:MAG: hypothetical protein B5M53_07440 [Candidatus Cloacimonas sp. 4484_209]|nr:MAG: hypothetical protein B5M53_07440 [Candidatus Cloacimonas sp. 4484_209]